MLSEFVEGAGDLSRHLVPDIGEGGVEFECAEETVEGAEVFDGLFVFEGGDGKLAGNHAPETVGADIDFDEFVDQTGHGGVEFSGRLVPGVRSGYPVVQLDVGEESQEFSRDGLLEGRHDDLFI